jgi:hypothetical protein
MARQSYYSEPWRKHLEVFSNFMGGINTMSSQDNMSDQELTNLVNMDLGERGSVSRRNGMVKEVDLPVKGKGQGFFRYYRTSLDFDVIVAAGGTFFVNGVQNTEITFQAEKPIEAVQFGDKLYIATGTKLMEYDGTFRNVEPYAPNPLEALYIGTNALADDPDNYLQDGVDSVLSVDGVTFSSRYGVMNEPFTLTAYHTAPEGMAVEYQFEYRYPYMEDGKWILGQDWSSSKIWTHTAEGEGDLQFRINAREQGLEVAEAQYLVPKYKIKPAPDPNDDEPDVSAIHSCTNIILHWNRLIMYGDPNNGDMIYISHLNNPAYFPTPNTLRFENKRKEGLSKVIQYRDSIVAFTPTSIQALYGKSPLDFRRVVLNTSIGALAPESVTVVRNYIYFLSQEGVYFLKSLGYVDDKANVEKVDEQIDSLVPKDVEANAVFSDSQYVITFPNHNLRLRFYLDFGSWTKDESTKLDFHRSWDIGGEIHGQSKETGDILRFDSTAWDDDGHVYNAIFETKFFSFGQPYHRKKLKELQVLASTKNSNTEANIYVYADSSITVNPDSSYATVQEDGSVVWVQDFEPNLKLYGGTVLGEWVMGSSPFGEVDGVVSRLSIGGKCLRTKVKILHNEPKPLKVLGLAYIFKIKKP